MPTELLEAEALSPLETFLREYVEAIGGAWDQVEPQVYDLLLPSDGTTAGWAADRRGMLRVAFDPEALAEHPSAQLASFGSPFVDRCLDDALRRGRAAEQWIVGLNLTPHDLPNRVRRGLSLAPDLRLAVERVRPLQFPQAVFWFQATLLSDQKEQEIVPVAIDLHYLRQVRHIEVLLDPARTADRPPEPMPEVRRSSVAAAYRVGQERVLRTVAALANTRGRELKDRTERQIDRMRRYYSDLRNESDELRLRAEQHKHDLSRFAQRRTAIEREERLRVAELLQKSKLELRLRLLNLLLVRQPKLLVRAVVQHDTATKASANAAPRRQQHTPAPSVPPAPPTPIELVWDPLTESLEAFPCTACHRPTYELALTRRGSATCHECAAAPFRGSPRL